MHIDVIDDIETLAKVRANWDSVYAADPDAQILVSWLWLSKWLEKRTRWFILAAKTDAAADDYVGFFPLNLKIRTRKGKGFHNNVSMAGADFADYTGFICLPEIQDRVATAFATHIKGLNWSKLQLKNLYLSDERTRLFLEHFSGDKFETTTIKTEVNDGIDLHKSPRIDLPADWEDYLSKSLGSSTRQKARRFLRKVEDSEEFRITIATAESLERDIEILLKFWEARWGSQKGKNLSGILRNNRTMLRHCFENESLFLPVLWNGDRPLAALATFIDAKRNALRFFIGGRDDTFRGSPPPGFVLHAYSIRHAIEHGFTSYDFMRGDEPYKYTFGASNRYLIDVIIRTSNGKNLGGRLDPRSLPVVFDRSFKSHNTGRLDEAMTGYRQILKVDPRHRKALYALSQLFAAKGDHERAVKRFHEFLALEPAAYKAWFKLGASLVAQSKFADAIAAYREVVKYKQEFVAYKALGDALLQNGEIVEAISAFENALQYKIPSGERWDGTAKILSGLHGASLARHAASFASLADKFRETGAHAIAVDFYRNAVSAQPSLIAAQLGLALALQGQKEIAVLSEMVEPRRETG